VDFSSADFEIHLVEGFDTREVLADLPAFQDAVHLRSSPLFGKRAKQDRCPASLRVHCLLFDLNY
jgi:hypothetical protein